MERGTSKYLVRLTEISPMRHLWLPLPLLLAVACNKDGEETGETDDTNAPGGCFTINEVDGYPSLDEALDAAVDGDSIVVCEDISAHMDITKSVTLVGGPDGTVWDAPINESGITVRNGATLTVENIAFTSTRSGIVVEAAGLVVRGAEFQEVANYGIEAFSSTVTVEDSMFDAPQWGGIHVESSTLDVSGSTFANVVGNGIAIEEEATATITGNTFTGTVPKTGDDLDVSGWAVLALDSAVVTSGNTFEANDYGDVRVDGGLATLSMDGDVSNGSRFGIWLAAASATLTNVSFTNYFQYGLVDEAGQTLDIVGSTFTTTHEGSSAATNTSFDENFSGSFGLIVLGADTTISATTVSGHNGGGIWQNQGTRTDGVSMTLEGVTVSDNNRFGVILYGGSMSFTDVAVSQTIDDTTACCDDTGCWCDMAVAAWQSDLTWVGGSLTGNGTFGLTALAGSANVTGVTFSDNTVYGAYIQDSVFTCDDCLFDEGRQYGVYLSGSSSVMDGTTFSNAAFTSEYEYEDTTTGDMISYSQHYQAQDVFVYGSSSLEITNGTFSNGETGLFAYDGSQITIQDSTFDGYNSEAVYAYYNSNVDISRTNFTNSGNNPIYCYYQASMNLDKVKITGVTEYDYWYEQYRNGELEYESKFTSPGTAVYAYSCTLSLEDVSIEDVWSRALYAGDASLELDGVTIRNVAIKGYTYDAGLYAYYSSVAPDIILNDVSITDVAEGYGIYVSGSSSVTGGYVEMLNLTLGDVDGTGIAGTGIYLSAIEKATIQGFDIQNVGVDGIQTNDTTATFTDGTISAPPGYGIQANESALTVTNVTIDEAELSGLFLGGGTHSVSGNTVNGAARYGVECAGSVAWDGCYANTLEGTMGETYECGCTEGGGDTDSGL